MKTRNLFLLLLGCVAAFCFLSCSDDDNEINLSQLKGMWIVKEPVLDDGFVTDYTFDPDNHTCTVYTGSPASNGAPIVCAYTINKEGTYITFSNEEWHFKEQYHILKLTADEMKWKNATPEDGNSDKRLEKVKD